MALLVISLFLCGSPPTVGLPSVGKALCALTTGIVAVDINAVEGMLWSGSVANVANEVEKTRDRLKPSFTNGNSPAAISREPVVVFVETPALCGVKRPIFGSVVHLFFGGKASGNRLHGSLFIDRLSDGSLFVPSTNVKPSKNNMLWNSSFFGPVGNTHGLAVGRQRSVSPCVSCLFLGCGPSAVRLPAISGTFFAFTTGIVPINVDSVHGVALGWSLADIFEEVIKGTRPSGTDLYPATTVTHPVFANVGICASGFDVYPSGILRSPRFSVSSVPVGELFAVYAPTTGCAATLEEVGVRCSFSSTVTVAQPQRPFSFTSTPNQTGNYKFSEPLSSNVNESVSVPLNKAFHGISSRSNS